MAAWFSFPMAYAMNLHSMAPMDFSLLVLHDDKLVLAPVPLVISTAPRFDAMHQFLHNTCS